MVFDPHHNIFYFYRGPTSIKSKKDLEYNVFDIQLENNTTKAFINVLNLSSPEICRDLLQNFLNIEFDKDSLTFALQKQTIGEQKIQKRSNRILWVISSKNIEIYGEHNNSEANKLNIKEENNKKSLPDAWIWDKNNVILMESKTNIKIDEDQLNRHEKVLKEKVLRKYSLWEEIHTYFKDKLNDLNYFTSINKDKDIFLIEQFVKYLELINLSKFSGWQKEDFEFFFSFDENEKERLRNKLNKFINEIFEDTKIANIIEKKRLGKLKEKSQNIWYQLDPKDKKFFINEGVPFLNFTIELYSDAFQVSIVFPVFPSIEKLKKSIDLKKSQILRKFEEILGRKINEQQNRKKIEEIVKSNGKLVKNLPNYKIRVFDHYFIMRGNRRWIPKAEMVIDPITFKNHQWFEFLEKLLALYHPNKNRDSNWGAGLHFLKEYPRGCEILLNPDELIKDVRENLMDFYEIAMEFVY